MTLGVISMGKGSAMPTAYRMLVLAAVSAALVILLWVLPASAQQVAVADVRVGPHPDKTRLVLDLTGPARFRYALAANGEAVFIDLPGANWRSAPFGARHSRGLITEFTHSAGPDGVSLSVLTDGPVAVKPPFLLPPGEGRGYRLVFDLVRSPRAMAATSPATSFGADPDTVEVASADPTYSPAPPPRNRTQMAAMRRSAQTDAKPKQVAQNATPPPKGRSGLFGVEGLYLRGGLGAAFLSTSDNSGSGNQNSTDYETGWELGGAIGMDLQNSFRVEAELRYATNNLQSINGSAGGSTQNSGTVDGDMSSLAVMANLDYDFPEQLGFTPFVFGGVGLAQLSLNDASVNGSTFANSSATVYAMQAGAGLSIEIDPRTRLEGYYRYFETGDPEFTDTSGNPFDGEYASHSFIAGIRISF